MLRLIYADLGYNRKELRTILEQEYGIRVEIVSRARQGMSVHVDDREKALEYFRSQKGFQVQPRRWVVERSFAWICKQRRLSKDYEYLPEVSEAYLYAAMALTTLRKIAQTNIKMKF